METTEDRIKAAYNARKRWGPDNDNWHNYDIARITLHEELGIYGDQRAPYYFNEDTRDILIVHARQDVAHTLSNTASLLRRCTNTQILVRILMPIIIALQVILIWRTW